MSETAVFPAIPPPDWVLVRPAADFPALLRRDRPRLCQSLVMVGGKDTGSQSGCGDHRVQRVCRAIVQGGRGDGAVQGVACGVGVESGDADEGVEYPGGVASGAVRFQG